MASMFRTVTWTGSVPPRGSGWVHSRAATDAHRASQKATHPPATAGGTDPVQQI